MTQDRRFMQQSRRSFFTPVVPTTALQVALVLSRPRATAGHRQSELFVLIGGVGRSGECRQDGNFLEIALIDDQSVLHTTPYRPAPTNICTSLSS